MFNILEEFANDNIHPNSRYFEHYSKYGQAVKALSDAESALIATLSEPQKKLLDDFTKAQSDIDYLTSTDKFIHGYSLGVLMTMEVFRTSDGMILNGDSE